MDNEMRRIVHMGRTGGPLCGQRDSMGRGWSNGPRTDDPNRVTCKKCLRKLGKLTSEAKTTTLESTTQQA